MLGGARGVAGGGKCSAAGDAGDRLPQSHSADASAHLVRGVRQARKDNGYVEGESVSIEYRWAEINSIDCRSWRPRWFAARSP